MSGVREIYEEGITLLREMEGEDEGERSRTIKEGGVRREEEERRV